MLEYWGSKAHNAFSVVPANPEVIKEETTKNGDILATVMMKIIP